MAGARCFTELGILTAGEEQLQPDGCTVCTCLAWGLECVFDACEHRTECEKIASEYERILTAARWCGPLDLSIDQQRQYSVCEKVTISAPDCGCPVVVRGALLTQAVADKWHRAGCTGSLACPPCEPLSGSFLYCGTDGFCTAGK